MFLRSTVARCIFLRNVLNIVIYMVCLVKFLFSVLYLREEDGRETRFEIETVLIGCNGVLDVVPWKAVG